MLVEVEQADGALPDVAAAFEERPQSPAYLELLDQLQDELARAVTNAFSTSFLLAAALALAALVPLWLGRREAGV